MTTRTPVTQSMMSTLINCEERMRLRYLERFTSPPSKALRTGSAVHLGFEVGSADFAVRAFEEAAGPAWTDSEDLQIATDAAVVRALVEGGLRRWDRWPSRAEVEFRVPFLNPETGRPSSRHDFAGKIDGVFLPGEFGDNEVPVLLEIKTSSRLDSGYLERLDLDWQVSAYLAAASDLFGVPVRQMVYRIARKPSIRPSAGETLTEYRARVAARKPLAPPKRKTRRSRPTGGQQHDYDLLSDGTWEESLDAWEERRDARESARRPLARRVPEGIEDFAKRLADDYRERPDFYFEEVVLTRTDQQIDRWRYEAWEAHRRILRIEGGGMTIRNPHHCLDYGRCAFFDLCRGVIGPSAFSVREDIHPELEGTTT